MPKFRKKPDVIEAYQVPPDNNLTRQLPPQWLISAIDCSPAIVTILDGGRMYVKTLDGTMRADVGDWIIRGVRGDLYPVPDDIFRMTYEPA